MKKFVVFLCVLSVSACALAANWTGSVDSDWGNGGNWSTGSVPLAGDVASIGTTANDPVLNYAAPAIKRLIVETATLTLDGGSLLSDTECKIGNSAGETGVVNVTNGSSFIMTKNMKVGQDGTGYLNITDSYAGVAAGGTELAVGVRNNAVGYVTITNSTVEIAKGVFIGKGAGNVGTVTMNSGYFSSNNDGVGNDGTPAPFNVGKDGTGTLFMNGGTIDAKGNFYIGANPGSTGLVEMTGGQILVTHTPKIEGIPLTEQYADFKARFEDYVANNLLVATTPGTEIDLAFDTQGDEFNTLNYLTITVVPEPATMVILAAGGLFLRRRK